MSEMEAVKNDNEQLREKVMIFAQNKKVSILFFDVLINNKKQKFLFYFYYFFFQFSCGSQTTFDDSYEGTTTSKIQIITIIIII